MAYDDFKYNWKEFYEQKGDDIGLNDEAKFLIKNTGSSGSNWECQPLTGPITTRWQPDKIPLDEATDSSGREILVSETDSFELDGEDARLTLVLDDENKKIIIASALTTKATGGSARGNREP